MTETYEGVLILLCHAVLVCAALLFAKGVELLHHSLRDPSAHPTYGTQALDFAIQAAEGVLAPALIAVGTASAIWTFAQRRKE